MQGKCLERSDRRYRGAKVIGTRYATALTGAVSAASDPAALAAQAAAANNPKDRICVYAYDRMNRQIQETTLGVKVATVNAGTGVVVDATGAVIETPTDITIQKRYDAQGNLIAQIQSTAETDYAYDARNRRIQELDPSFTDFNGLTVRSVTTTVYDGVGNVKQVDQNGNKTLYEYDAHGNLTRETDPLGGPTRYFYDLNGNITAKRSRCTNPDGAAPYIEGLYTYDKLNRQTSTTEARNLTYFARYDAYGEIVAKGLNGVDREYEEYDKAGRLIKTNKDDGVDRAYLYDANGNETAKIQSAIQDTYLKPLTIGQIADLSATLVQRTESAYDARNQLTRTYQPPVDIATDNVSGQEIWVDTLNNPFIGGTLTPMQGGTFPIVVTATDSNGCQGSGATYNLTITCPTITVTTMGKTSERRGERGRALRARSTAGPRRDGDRRPRSRCRRADGCGVCRGTEGSRRRCSPCRSPRRSSRTRRARGR